MQAIARFGFRRTRAFALLMAAVAGFGDAALGAVPYPPPAGYYASADKLTGAALHNALATLSANHVIRSYGDARDILGRNDTGRVNIAGYPNGTHPRVDVAAADSTEVTLIYSGRLFTYVWAGTNNTWNREHIWPKSRGFPNSGDGNTDAGVGSNLFNLRACNPSINTTRNNRQFNWAVPGSTGYVNTGNAAPWPAAPNLSPWNSATDVFEPQDPDKGYVARAILYMATRYEGADADVGDLILVENAGPDASTGGQMGVLSTLLEWNRRFPPTEWERRRNDLVGSLYQGTVADQKRNPFIDVPEFADAIYGVASPPTGSPSVRLLTYPRWRQTHFTTAELVDTMIPADDADPDGDGQSNLLEYACNGNPRTPNAQPFPSIALVNNGGSPEWRVSYREIKDGNVATTPALAGRPPSHGLTYTVQASSDLVTWTDVIVPGNATRTSDALNETDLVTFADSAAPTAISADGKRYYRLVVTRLF